MKTTMIVVIALIAGFVLGWFSQGVSHDREVTEFIENYWNDQEREDQILALTSLMAIRQFREGRPEIVESQNLQRVAFYYGLYGPHNRDAEAIPEDTWGSLKAIEREIEINLKLKEAVDNELAEYPGANKTEMPTE